MKEMLGNNTSMACIWSILTGVFWTVMVHEVRYDGGEWFLWYVAAIGFSCMTVISWSTAQMDVISNERVGLNEEEYRQLHKIYAYEMVISWLLKEERYEDAYKLQQAIKRIKAEA